MLLSGPKAFYRPQGDSVGDQSCRPSLLSWGVYATAVCPLLVVLCRLIKVAKAFSFMNINLFALPFSHVRVTLMLTLLLCVPNHPRRTGTTALHPQC